MAAAELLQSLASRGVTLAMTPEGLLSATPASALQDVDRAAIRAHRDELVKLLSGDNQAAGDELHTCTACRNWVPGRCTTHRAAGLELAELAAGWETLPQRCRGFRTRQKAPAMPGHHHGQENVPWAVSGAARAMSEWRAQ